MKKTQQGKVLTLIVHFMQLFGPAVLGVAVIKEHQEPATTIDNDTQHTHTTLPDTFESSQYFPGRNKTKKTNKPTA